MKKRKKKKMKKKRMRKKRMRKKKMRMNSLPVISDAIWVMLLNLHLQKMLQLINQQIN